jgi:hypothetical protein
VEYKSSHVKQYFKEQHALRTETTIKPAGPSGAPCSPTPTLPRPLRDALDQLDVQIQKLHQEAALAA